MLRTERCGLAVALPELAAEHAVAGDEEGQASRDYRKTGHERRRRQKHPRLELFDD